MRRLQKKIREQDQAINDLKQGEHDIELEGGSQDDMEDLFEKCNADPSLAANIKANDSTGVLDLFWQEQRRRMSDPDGCKLKRKRWNPIVLRYIKWVGCCLICCFKHSQ